MSDTPSALDRVMQQAEDASASFVPSDNTALAVRSTGSQLAPATKRPSLDSFMDDSGISVDQYLQLKYEGFSTSEFDALFDSDIIASININEIVPIVQVRETKNGTTNFLKSYDGEVTTDKQNLAAAVERLNNTPGTVVTGPYQTSEVPFTVLEDITVPGKSGGTIAAGTRIGTTPPITGTKYLAAFLKELRDKGFMGETVKVRIVHLPKTNTKGNKWGVADFKFIEVIEDAE